MCVRHEKFASPLLLDEYTACKGSRASVNGWSANVSWKLMAESFVAMDVLSCSIFWGFEGVKDMKY